MTKFYTQKELTEFHSYIKKKLKSMDGPIIREKDGKSKQGERYFLREDSWFLGLFQYHPKFSKFFKGEKFNRPIFFECDNPDVKLECKYVFYHWLVEENQALFSPSNRHALEKLNKYIDDRHPNLFSLLELDLETVTDDWKNWLEDQQASNLNPHRNFLKKIYEILSELYVYRYVDYDSDEWALSNLPGILHSSDEKIKRIPVLDFGIIDNSRFRSVMKGYVLKKVFSEKGPTVRNGIECHAAIHEVAPFLNYLSDVYPDWKDLNSLTSEDTADYLRNTKGIDIAWKVSSSTDPSINILLPICRIILSLKKEFNLSPDVDIDALFHITNRKQLIEMKRRERRLAFEEKRRVEEELEAKDRSIYGMLRRERKKLGFSNSQLATQLEIDPSKLARYEKGGNVPFEFMIKWLQFFQYEFTIKNNNHLVEIILNNQAKDTA